MGKGSFTSRRRELEDKFFHERDQALLQALREQRESKERKKALSEASGIANEELLDQLDALDIRCETLAALSLVPMIAVAWADGTIDPKERRAVITAAEQKGIEPEHPGHQLLEGWLRQKPDGAMLAVWKDYVAALTEVLNDTAIAALKYEVLGRARSVAEAAGGLLGLGSKISKSEQAVLTELEEALG